MTWHINNSIINGSQYVYSRSSLRRGGHGGRRGSCSLRSRSLSNNMREATQTGAVQNNAARSAPGSAQERTALTDDISAVP